MLFIKKNKVGISIMIFLIVWLCWDIYKNHIEFQDVYNATMYYFMEGSISLFQLLMPVFVIMAGIKQFYDKLKSGYFKHEIIRKSYKKYMIKEVLSAWKSSLIAPILILISFIVSCFMNNFDLSFPVYVEGLPLPIGSSLSHTIVPNPIVNIVTIALNLTLLAIACINVGLILSKKEKSYFLTVILSFLILIAYQIIAEVVIGVNLTDLTGILFFANGVNFFCFWYYDGTSPLSQFLYGMFLVIITTIILYFVYRKKEGVIIASEK